MSYDFAAMLNLLQFTLWRGCVSTNQKFFASDYPDKPLTSNEQIFRNFVG